MDSSGPLSTTPESGADGQRGLLERYDVLNGPFSPDIYRLVQATAEACRTPCAALAFVIGKQTIYRAIWGFPSEEQPSRCTAGDADQQPVHTDTHLEVPCGRPAVPTGTPTFLFSVGAPLLTPDGQRLGTLYALDTQPRGVASATELNLLQVLADSVMRALELLRLERQANQREALNQAILDAAPDAVIRIDPAGRVLAWNTQAETLFGFSRAEALGRTIDDMIVPSRDRDAHRAGLARFVHSAESRVIGRHMEVTAQKKGGGEFPCAMVITAVQLDDALSFTAYLSDLSAQRQAQKDMMTSRNLLRAVLDGVPEAILVKDLDRRFVMVNAAAAQLLRLDPLAICGQTAEALVGPDYADQARAQDDAVLSSGEALIFELQGIAADGTPRTFLTSKTPYRNATGQVIGVIQSAVDITARKQLEQLLTSHNVELERRVVERTQALEDAQRDMLVRLARAAEIHDDQTGQHVQRVASTAGKLAQLLGLPSDVCQLITQAAPLHDLGKIGVPDAILLKADRLTPDEQRLMQTHTVIGARLLEGGQSALSHMAHDIALTHHERWDGFGYPQGLVGPAIPLAGRIVAVADVLDALTTHRPYKEAWSLEEAIAEIKRGAGRDFDPLIVDLLDQLT